MTFLAQDNQIDSEADNRQPSSLRAVSYVRGFSKSISHDLEKNILSRRRNGGVKALPSNCELAFLGALTSSNISENETTTQQQTYLTYVRQQILSFPASEFRPVLSACAANEPTADTTTDEVFALLTELARCARTSSHFSIDKAIRSVNNDGCSILVPEAFQDGELYDKTRILTFSCLAWIGMLHSPLPFNADVHGLLAIDSSQCMCIVNTQPTLESERTFCEMIQNFGPLLPLHKEEAVPNMHDATFSAESLYVSLLNAKTLSQIGGISIEWIDNVSSHMEFDPESARLMLFRLPSFCDMNRYENTAFSALLSEYYDEFNKPPGFTCASFLKEIRRSYRLIFADDSNARRLYSNKERKRASKNGLTDPYLDELCLRRNDSTIHDRSTYSKATDFPILASRLSVLQEHIQRQNPKSLAMIWQDKRNPTQWYTLWAVIVIGGIGVLLSTVQTGLAAAQVYYAAHPPFLR